MTINSPENRSIDSKNWQVSKKAPLIYNECFTSGASSKRRIKNVSPYLNGEKVKLSARNIEKKVVQKKTTNVMPSFSLSANIYKANSDEFKIPKRGSKRGKKCVHSVPTVYASQPQTCTVSDMNDSEYNETKISRKPRPKVRKRRLNKMNAEKNIEIYDRDAKYCSQFNIHLDSSSSDMFQHLTGDGKKVLKKPKNIYGRNQIIGNDVWSVLRNLNKIQFIPSPPMTGSSIESIKNISTKRRSCERNDASFVETCRTEEFAYISYDSTSLDSHSRSSSFDRVTVIGKQDDVTKTITYTKRSYRDDQRKDIGNQKRKRILKNINNKTDSKNKQGQQKHVQEDVLYSQNNIINRDENNVENEIKTISDIELKPNGDNILTKAEPEKTCTVSELERQEQVNGITRVVLTNGVELHDSENSCIQREARKCQPMSTSPNSIKTQLTTADIKRKLANLKYPVVVTGKDKLSSYIHVNDCKPIQFSGLDQHIWPYMIKWLPESEKATFCLEIDSPRIPCNNIASCKLHNNVKLKKNKKAPEKEKPMRIFKDKMLNLMYSNKYSIVQNNKNNNTMKVKHDSAETQTHSTKTLIKKDICSALLLDEDTPHTDHLKLNAKQPSAKSKWASDFIENVIRKVKSGVYYGQESKKRHKCIDTVNNFTQTEILLTEVTDGKVILKDDTVSEHFYNGIIPGFENKIQDLELHAVSKSQIAVKHCNTNVVVQFDIAFPIDTNGLLQETDSILHLPLEISATRIYKYKETITNAILPAELCSIFPKMLSNIFDSNIIPQIPKSIANIASNDIFDIKELTRRECVSTFNKVSINSLSTTSLPILQTGRFSRTTSKQIIRPKMMAHVHKFSTFRDLFPEIEIKALIEKSLSLCKIPSLYNAYSTPKQLQKLTACNLLSNNIKGNTCTAIVPYIPIRSKPLDLTDQMVFTNNKTNSHLRVDFDLSLVCPFKVEHFGTKLVVSLYNNSEKSSSFDVSNLGMDSLYKYYENVRNNENSFVYDNKTDLDEFIEQDTKCSKRRVIIKNFNRRKSYVKLCKKCKSTSSIPHYKMNTPLQKIANLDEFFEALGSSKNLSSAIDGDTERKILLSLVKMKAWITAISPRQALMILVFANKKETSNIIRFRNVILQGIAMNRITKISELDMEIEVIERENLIISFEDLSDLAETQDNLLEELCWIAKTTASDHQKPFDKTSERLLKSLLDKRKRLNPSYLRVLARYVGLGLLKSK